MVMVTVQSFGQVEFKTNTKDRFLSPDYERKLEIDANIKFELRFWTEQTFCPLTFLQITLNNQGRWNYRTGSLDTIKKLKI